MVFPRWLRVQFCWMEEHLARRATLNVLLTMHTKMPMVIKTIARPQTWQTILKLNKKRFVAKKT